MRFAAPLSLEDEVFVEFQGTELFLGRVKRVTHLSGKKPKVRALLDRTAAEHELFEAYVRKR